MTPLRYIITSGPRSLLLCVIFAAFLFTTEHFLVKGIKCAITATVTKKQKCVHTTNVDLFYASDGGYGIYLPLPSDLSLYQLKS